jgi:hypothetical protein
VEWGGIDAELYASVKRARMDGFIATNNLARCLDSTEPKRIFGAHNCFSKPPRTTRCAEKQFAASMKFVARFKLARF